MSNGRCVTGTLRLWRAIVAPHSGRIWAESEGAGRGATFFFTLVAATQESPAVNRARSV